MKNFDKAKFLIDINKLVLKTKNCYMLNEDFNPEAIFEQFLNGFSEILNSQTPLRRQTRNEIRLKTKPQNGILKSTKKKNAMFKYCYKKNDLILMDNYYKKFSNILTSVKRTAK